MQIELEGDAWERFELAVDQVVKAPPQHRPLQKEKTRAAAEHKARRKRKGAKLAVP